MRRASVCRARGLIQEGEGPLRRMSARRPEGSRRSKRIGGLTRGPNKVVEIKREVVWSVQASHERVPRGIERQLIHRSLDPVPRFPTDIKGRVGRVGRVGMGESLWSASPPARLTELATLKRHVHPGRNCPMTSIAVECDRTLTERGTERPEGDESAGQQRGANQGVVLGR